MSSVASNYNITLLQLGIAIGIFALLCAVSSVWIASPRKRPQQSSLNPSLVWLALITSAYSAMMFSSSYVEEEQHFWYWVNSAWAVWLYLTRSVLYNTRGNISDPLTTRYNNVNAILPIAALVIASMNRVAIRWNQTGQKHAGASDIAKTFLPAHNNWLWFLVISTYAYLLLRLTQRRLPKVIRPIIFVSTLGTIIAAVTFKVAFTAADAPELLAGCHFIDRLQKLIHGSPLTSLARCVYVGLSLSTLLLALAQWSVQGRCLYSVQGLSILGYGLLFADSKKLGISTIC